MRVLSLPIGTAKITACISSGASANQRSTAATNAFFGIRQRSTATLNAACACAETSTFIVSRDGFALVAMP